MSVYRLRIAGIGGQGTVHLSKTLAAAAKAEGIPVSMIERPRSAMRLGPIVCDLIFNDTEFAPFIVAGEADAVLGMEPLDGIMNAAYYSKKDGTVLLQGQPTPTVDEYVLLEEDPRRIEWKAELIERGVRVETVFPEGENMAGRNYYMLGALVALCPDLPVGAEAIEKQLLGQEMNLAMFRRGLAHQF